MQLTPNDCLAAAWTYCAPNRLQSVQFPTGFWPDVARVAMEMFAQQTTRPTLAREPSKCVRGDWPENRVVRKNLAGIDFGKLEIKL